MSRITVVTADRAGLIAELSERLAAQQINIAAIDGRAVGTDAVLHLEVDDLPAALAVLTGAGFQALSDDVVIVQVDDTPGALARIARQLADARLDIRMVRTLSRSAGHGIVALTTDDNARARTLLAGVLL